MHVTVCICTRNRGNAIVPALRSVAALVYPDYDVVIVDQSTSDESECAVREVLAHAARNGCVTYVRTPTVGLSRARNIAVAHARGPILAFTDDDCVVAPHWLTALVSYFRMDERVGQISGPMLAAPEEEIDCAVEFIPHFLVRQPRRFVSAWRTLRETGVGGNLALRKDVLARIGPFDEALGAGSAFHSGEDIDINYRVLRAGYHVLNVPEPYVVHHGRHPLREYMLASEYGAGAAFMKHLRLGDVAVVPTFARRALGCIVWRKLLLLRRGNGLNRSLACVRGALASLRYPLDRQRRVYSAEATPAVPTPADVVAPLS